MTDKTPAMPEQVCPKCGATSGDDWSQCKGSCPLPGTPHYLAALQSAQPAAAVSDEEIDAVIKRCRIAGQYVFHDGLRAFARAILALRPAAQAGEREADDCDVTGQHGPLPETGWDEAPPEAFRKPSPTAGMNLGQRIKHVGGRENAAGYIEFGSVAAVRALVRQYLRDLPTQPAAQATPEPVGEPFGWGVVNKDGFAQDFRPLIKSFFGGVLENKPFGPEYLSMMDRDFSGDAPHRVVTLFTRPAPGVPEDVQRNAARWEEVLRQVGADRQCGGFRFTLYNLRPVHGSNPMQGAVCQHFTQAVDAALAAAQAKGADHV